jgi:hypothetical protein
MTWAGPLPPGDLGDVVETMTFAGPLAVIGIEQQSATADTGGPAMWAGPLPPWMDRASAKARVAASLAAAL